MPCDQATLVSGLALVLNKTPDLGYRFSESQFSKK